MPESAWLEKPAYPVVFVILLSLVFVGVLALVYRLNEPGIQKQTQEAYERAILGLCVDSLAALSGKTAGQIQAEYPRSFNEYVRALPAGNYPRKAFEVRYGGRLLAYIFDITGKGLWGTMRALAATDQGKTTVLGVNIYEQMETPGLGARIGEDWFTGQFKRKAILVNGVPVKFTLIPEGQAASDPTQVRQVTGATITSNAVIKMLQTELALIGESAAEVKQ